MNETKKINIGIITKFFFPYIGGIENSILNVHKHLATTDFTINIYTSKFKNTKSLSFERLGTLIIWRLKIFSITSLKALFKNDIVVVENFNLLPSSLILIISSLLKLIKYKRFDLIFVPHGGITPNWDNFGRVSKIIKKSYTHTIGLKLLNYCADKIITVSEWEKIQLVKLKISGSKLSVIPNPIEIEAFQPLSEIDKETLDRVIIYGDYAIQIGKIYPTKNYELTINALENTKKINLVILGPVGNYAYFEKIKKLIANKNLIDRVHFITDILTPAQKYCVISNAKFQIHTAKWENYGSVVYEGMSKGIIQIVTNTGNLPYIVKEGINGFIANSTKEDLAKCINYVCDNYTTKEMKQIKQNNIETAKNLHEESIATKTQNLYISLKSQVKSKNIYYKIQNNLGSRIKSFFNKFFMLSVTLIVTTILIGSIRGNPGNPTISDLNTPYWRDEGPLELSPERGRYALIYALAELKSFSFPVELARFATPDVGYSNGRYLSLFMPGVSLIAIPGYLLGKSIGLAQIGTTFTIALFALLNFILIYKISIKVGTNKIASLLGGITFLFASPAFTYAVTLYQHHISTFLLLITLYILMSNVTISKLGVVWMCLGIAVLVDIPNFFLAIPIGFFALSKVIKMDIQDELLKINFKPLLLISIITIIIPLGLILGYNHSANGHFTKLPGSLPQAPAIDDQGLPATSKSLTPEEKLVFEAQQENKGNEILTQWFKTRRLLSGFEVHLTSADRGMITFTPILFIVGLTYLLVINRKYQPIYTVLTTVAGLNVIFYSMWGDPWGGWAFGSRYLVPTYAILGIFTAVLLTRYSKNLFVLTLYVALMFISLRINTMGALTSSRIPPRPEVLALEKLSGKEEKFNYKKSEDQLNNNKSKSYIYNTYLSNKYSAWEYNGIILSILFGGTTILCCSMFILQKGNKYEL